MSGDDISNQILALRITNEIYKQRGLIKDYEITLETKNYSIDESGMIYYDLVVNQKIYPNIQAKDITVTIGFKE